MTDGENIFEDVAKLKKNVAFIADALQLDLPKDKNYHDCIIHTIEMSGDEEGNLFLNMRNYFREMKKIQVKFCPVCGFEGNDPPCFKLATFPRSGDGPREY